jgi:hypothetical protein
MNKEETENFPILNVVEKHKKTRIKKPKIYFDTI